ncbi:MAG: class I SAM-dependent methyltransferase [Betaproteobacteria bacterium]
MQGPTLPVAFDETFYLDEYPDVLEAVERGLFASGLEHYLTHGQGEGRTGRPAETPTECRFPGRMPPKALRTRVHGAGDPASFQIVGKRISDDLHAAIRDRVALVDSSKLLDFGCGCARVMAYFRQVSPGAFYGTDIDREAIDWCRGNLGHVADFAVNAAFPKLAFGADSFDLIYSISVFTHLPEAMQSSWLEELRRVAKPGSYLFLTTLGEQELPQVSIEDRTELERHGFLYLLRGGTEGLPEFYQSSFQTSAYIEATWRQWFDIETVVTKGICDFQDLVICRKPG